MLEVEPKENGAAGAAAVVEEAGAGAVERNENGLDDAAGLSVAEAVEVEAGRVEVMNAPAAVKPPFLGVSAEVAGLSWEEDPNEDVSVGVMLPDGFASAAEGDPNEKPVGLDAVVDAEGVDPPNENPPEGDAPDKVDGKVENGVEAAAAPPAGASSLAPPNENPPPPPLLANTGGFGGALMATGAAGACLVFFVGSSCPRSSMVMPSSIFFLSSSSRFDRYPLTRSSSVFDRSTNGSLSTSDSWSESSDRLSPRRLR